MSASVADPVLALAAEYDARRATPHHLTGADQNEVQS